METQNFRAKKGLSYTYIGIPAFLFLILIITLTASGGDFYVGPGGLSILFLIMGIWYLNNDVIVKEGNNFTIKLSALAKKHCFTLDDIKEVENRNYRRIIIHLNSSKKIKIAMNLFSEEDKTKIGELFR